ncbi:fimbrial protein [Serratia fonticola]|jgi:type 1 fimbria pilin|nr:fimbrial protein [Serratia fonticola]CAI1043204.1 Minor fimbrial protein prsF precursor [Serratia fonticola]CAI1172768.1 Minor fimbrial protein prsF precursor [Serratia fonticola]CAI1758802.1 Minor fimbrial protein prsF precursor [Serratia fonticola]CAI1911871.1 Minor fimbrial protein prsF precursor [Serratia fonticola]CAI2537877.1 Minor fimbrial protein prsF precursor [Serratia fonticola]
MNGTTMSEKAAFLLCGLLTTLPQVAAGANTATVTVKVTVVVPPQCTINDNRPIEVEFGDVITTRMDGNSYRMPVNYTLGCTGAYFNAMKLQVQGEGASFDWTVLKTTKTGLGIKLQQGSNKLAINSWLNFTYPNQPELWAIPVKQGGATLTGGEFTAGATMKVAYQ